MSLIKEYVREQGGNAYTFGLNDGTTVLALLSEEPIVKVEKYINENKKYKFMPKIRITEKKLKQIVAESINRVLNEEKLHLERTIEVIKGDLDNIINNIERVKIGNFSNLKTNDFYMFSRGYNDFNKVLKYIGQRQDGNRNNF